MRSLSFTGKTLPAPSTASAIFSGLGFFLYSLLIRTNTAIHATKTAETISVRG
jgi:hypothetical protein